MAADLEFGDIGAVPEPPDPWIWWGADPEMQMLMNSPRKSSESLPQAASSSQSEGTATVGASTPLYLQCRYCRRPFVAKSQERPWSANNKLQRHEEICAKRHCEHCCALFKSALECRGHAPLCRSNYKFQRCEFCTTRFKNAAEKRSHEATCELNPAICCEFCGKHFGHTALRNRHMQCCAQDPQLNCIYCKHHFRSRLEVVSHEVSCKENPSTTFRQDECVACSEARQCLRFPCGTHSYCVPCLLKMLGVGLKDRSLLPLRCCKRLVEIGDPVDITLGSLLPETSRLKYQESMVLHGATHAMYCPNIKCGIVIILDTLVDLDAVRKMRHGWHTDVDLSDEATSSSQLSASAIGCPRCQQAICFKCRSEWHEGMNCAQYQFFAAKIVDEVTKFCRKMNWMRCFACGHVVEKKAGCNHMTCVCGSQFCYLCGSQWGTCTCQIVNNDHALRHNRGPAENIQRCPHCAQVFDSAEELRVHVNMCQRAAASRGAYECATCLARFANYGEYRLHRRECVARATELQNYAAEDHFGERRDAVMAGRRIGNASAP